MRALSLCSGIGTIDLAASWAGIEIAGQVEIDEFCQAVLAKHWPHVKRLADIYEVNGNEFGPIDLVVAGFPCQPTSLAGQRRGAADDRWLWPEVYRIIAAIRPRWIVLENTAGLLSLGIDEVLADLEGKDTQDPHYEAQVWLIPACAIGAPHQRERVFILAHTDSNRCRNRQNQSQRQPWGGGPSDPGVYGEHGYVADASSAGLSLWERIPGARPYPTTSRNGQGQAQPRLGRVLDGPSAWMDGHRWPARPGEAQHAWEPPRTTGERIPNRTARLKALGNSVVPQQIYPIFAAIMAAEHPTK